MTKLSGWLRYWAWYSRFMQTHILTRILSSNVLHVCITHTQYQQIQSCNACTECKKFIMHIYIDNNIAALLVLKMHLLAYCSRVLDPFLHC